MEIKKKIIIIIVGIILIGGIASFIVFRSNQKTDTEVVDNVSQELKKLNKLRDILDASGYFTDSKYNLNEKEMRLTINSNYDIIIKNGYYMMTIKSDKDEDEYCKVVDAVMMSFGSAKGASTETCKETLDGTINLGGINVEFYDSYKVLTVNSEEASTLLSVEATHQNAEIISNDEINYDIKIGDYWFTSMSVGTSSEIKTQSVCGHVYSSKKNTKDFIFKIYDENKNLLNEKTYTYQNDTDKYATFCIDFDIDTKEAKYYSVEES